ncbi:hypothetical protein DUI87_07943 [Hirundo rustica rustica]|uniref:Uncharacterized protein n=1 Tax=Hirundo rustica rustica TaxID=333673 RepID=A0A3M0KR43_HIRRU|nr:hypothetical protein DUI87_07943 [Hirundo rustica rustica]
MGIASTSLLILCGTIALVNKKFDPFIDMRIRQGMKRRMEFSEKGNFAKGMEQLASSRHYSFQLQEEMDNKKIDSVKSPNVTYNVIPSSGMTTTTLEDLEFKT